MLHIPATILNSLSYCRSLNVIISKINEIITAVNKLKAREEIPYSWLPGRTLFLWRDFSKAPEIDLATYTVNDRGGNPGATPQLSTTAFGGNYPWDLYGQELFAAREIIFSSANAEIYGKSCFISFWAKISATATTTNFLRLFAAVIIKSGEYDNAYIDSIVAGDKSLYANMGNNEYGCIIDEDDTAANEWHHFVVTIDNNILRYYYDGKIIAKRVLTDDSLLYSLHIGDDTYMFPGEVAEIVEGGGSLTEKDIGRLFAHGLVEKENGTLIAERD